MDADLEDRTEVILERDIDYWTKRGKIDLKPWEVIVVGDGDKAVAESTTEYSRARMVPSALGRSSRYPCPVLYNCAFR